MPTEVPTRQEMFNRAWKGLKAQGFERALTDDDRCVYLTADGKRCAWGHVDPEGTTREDVPNGASVYKLNHKGLGLAACLFNGDLEWADRLQRVHDAGNTPEAMRASLVEFADRHGLTIPEDE